MTTDVTIINTVASVSVTNGDSLDVEITIPVIAVSASTVGIQGTSGAGSDEDVQDIVGAMVSGNTETLITVTYQDIDGTLDFSVDNDLANYDNTTSGFITGYAVTEGDVTAHQAALSITESQISDFGSYIPFADATIANMLVSNGTSFVSVPMSGDATIAANGAISVTFPTAPVTSVNTKTGVVVLDPDDLSDAATINKFVTASDITVLGNTSGENTGDQTIPATGVDFDPVGTDNSDNNAINTLYSGLVSNATHTGDVTGANALTIGANKVTLAMQSQMATASFLGRTTAATGNVEVLSKAQALAVLNVEDGATAGGAVDSVNAQTGVVVLDADDISDAATTNKFVTAYDVTVLGNTSNTNSGDNAANTTYDNDYRAANFVSGTDYEPAKGIDDNFVTDVEKVVIGNTSGTNTGDQVIPASGVDFDPVGTDNSDDNAVNSNYANDYRLANFVAGTHYEPAKGADDNFVTDAEKIVLGNTSGTNTGDQIIPASGVDFDPVGTDNSDDNAVNSNYANDYRLANFVAGTHYEPAKGADDNFVTDAEKIVLGNTSGTNTGDQIIPATGVDFDPVGTDNSDNNAVNTLYSGLVSNATHTGDVTGSGVLTIANSAVTLVKMASTVTARFLGRVTAGTGIVEYLTKAQMLTALNVADGATIDQTPTEIKTAYESLTNHALNNPTFTGGVTEEQYSMTGTVVDPANGTMPYKTLTSNTTLTENLSDGESVLLAIDDGTAYTITWFTITWLTDGGTAPTLVTSGYTFISIIQLNGVVYGAKVNS